MLEILIIIQLLSFVVVGCFVAIKVIERKREKNKDNDDLLKYKKY